MKSLDATDPLPVAEQKIIIKVEPGGPLPGWPSVINGAGVSVYIDGGMITTSKPKETM